MRVLHRSELVPQVLRDESGVERLDIRVVRGWRQWNRLHVVYLFPSALLKEYGRRGLRSDV